MSTADKLLDKMRTNPRDWRIENLKTVAQAYNIEWRQRGSSHVVFIRSDGQTLPVSLRGARLSPFISRSLLNL